MLCPGQPPFNATYMLPSVVRRGAPIGGRQKTVLKGRQPYCLRDGGPVRKSACGGAPPFTQKVLKLPPASTNSAILVPPASYPQRENKKDHSAFAFFPRPAKRSRLAEGRFEISMRKVTLVLNRASAIQPWPIRDCGVLRPFNSCAPPLPSSYVIGQPGRETANSR